MPSPDATGHACVPSPEAVGQALGPRARAARAARPRIVDDLRRAREWQRQIDASEAASAAQLARDHGVTRARISQLMTLLRLAPEIQAYIDGLDGTEGCYFLTERKLRGIALAEDHDEQLARFEDLVGVRLAPCAGAAGDRREAEASVI